MHQLIRSTLIAPLIALFCLGALFAGGSPPSDTPVRWDFDLPSSKAADENRELLSRSRQGRYNFYACGTDLLHDIIFA